MAQTLIGIFDDYTGAQQAMQALAGAGLRREEMQLTSAHEAQPGASAGAKAGSTIKNFFNSLFGGGVPEDEVGYYSEAVRRGGAALTVRVADNNQGQADRVADLLEQHGAIDIDQRVAQWRERGWTGFDPNAAPLTAQELTRERDFNSAGRAGLKQQAGDMTLPVVEEQLRVGKREVERGRLRVRSYVTELPVEETVRLREEHVNVERRQVDRPLADADLAAFKEGTIEMTETAEEAVVSKQARVVEEVVVSKDVVERDEQIRDTVRRTDVKVEELTPEQRRDQPRKGGR